MREYYVYIMTNGARTLYIGVTNDLMRRVYEHKQKLTDGFAKKYNITMLIYYETTDDVRSAIAREKQLKLDFTQNLESGSDGRPRSGAAPPVAGLGRFFTVRSRH